MMVNLSLSLSLSLSCSPSILYLSSTSLYSGYCTHSHYYLKICLLTPQETFATESSALYGNDLLYYTHCAGNSMTPNNSWQYIVGAVVGGLSLLIVLSILLIILAVLIISRKIGGNILEQKLRAVMTIQRWK